MTVFRVGFPLAAVGSDRDGRPQYEFVVVEPYTGKAFRQGWIGDRADDFVLIDPARTGSIKTIEQAVSTEIVYRKLRFHHFRHGHEADSRPARWHDASDMAAVALALSRRRFDEAAPIVLVSAACNFLPDQGFQGATVAPVAESGASLRDKWNAAVSSLDVIALVLTETDAQLLSRTAGLGAPRKLTSTRLRDLRRGDGLPPIIGINADELPTLAGALGGHGSDFELRTGECAPRLVSQERFVAEYQSLLDSGEFSVIKFFGYTGEVVTSDLIRYADRYNEKLDVRILLRSWELEQRDENAHNARITAGTRPWRKADEIRRISSSEWTHVMRRTIRHYLHQPIIKGVILCSTKTPLRRVAYFGFLRWESNPTNGGSQFKSVPSYMIHLDSADGAVSWDLVDRIDSQFEYEWEHHDIMDK